MLKVLLADDERLIREGIRDAVPWPELGMTIAGVAENGETALALARQIMPDVIITDICMPRRDGLSFVQEVQDTCPDAFVILITGFDEFEYARKAIKLGVYDYILKPIDLEYLQALLRKICGLYEERGLQAQKTGRRKELLRALIQGRPVSALYQELRDAGLPAEDHYLCACFQALGYPIARAKFADTELDRYFEQFFNLVDGLAREHGEIPLYTLPDRAAGRAYLILHAPGSAKIQEQVSRLAGEAKRTAELVNAYPFLLGIGDCVPGLSRLEESCTQCGAVMDQAFHCEETTVIHHRNLSAFITNTRDISKEIAGALAFIKTFDWEFIDRGMRAVAELIKASGADSQIYFNLFLSGIYTELLRSLRELGLEVDEACPGAMGKCRAALCAPRLQAGMGIMLSLLRQACEYVNGNGRSYCSMAILKAKSFIEARHSDSGLSLNQVAEHVGTSPSYFSVRFKEECGQSFIGYLTEIRMNHAKRLLETTQLKSYEICEQIGYDNPTYFSTLFKKLTGMSPKAYRSVARSGSPSGPS